MNMSRFHRNTALVIGACELRSTFFCPHTSASNAH